MITARGFFTESQTYTLTDFIAAGVFTVNGVAAMTITLPPGFDQQGTFYYTGASSPQSVEIGVVTA